MNRSLIFPLKIYIYTFFIRIYFHGHWRLTWQQWKGWDHRLFHSTTSTCSRTSIHLSVTISCETIFVISHICNCTTCIYQPAPRSDLQPYRMTILLIDDVKLVFVCLCDDLILAFCYSNWRRETSEFDLTSTITHVLQANQLTKCALFQEIVNH